MGYSITVDKAKNLLFLKMEGRVKKIEQIKIFNGLRKSDKLLKPQAGIFVDTSSFEASEEKPRDFSNLLKNVKYTAVLKGMSKEGNLELWDAAKTSESNIRFFHSKENALKWLDRVMDQQILISNE